MVQEKMTTAKVLDSFTGKAMERVQCKQTVTGSAKIVS